MTHREAGRLMFAERLKQVLQGKAPRWEYLMLSPTQEGAATMMYDALTVVDALRWPTTQPQAPLSP